VGSGGSGLRAPSFTWKAAPTGHDSQMPDIFR
jgi:hypothetical protein